MPYRDDQEAALARIDVLTRENEQLENELARLRAVTHDGTRPTHVRLYVFLAVVAGIAILIVLNVIVAATPTPSRLQVSSIDPEPAAALERDLLACIAKLGGNPHLGATFGKPDLGPTMRHSLLVLQSDRLASIRMMTGCRGEIERYLDHGTMSAPRRAALERWQSAESELDATIRHVVTYYGTDTRFDGDADERLWRVLDQHYDRRNAVLAEWLATR